MIYVTRKAHFSAAHRLYNPTFSDERNEAIFDKCNNPRGHGHNYTLEVSVTGPVDAITGYVMDLGLLRTIVEQEVIEQMDHRNLNLEVEILRGINPTAENIVVACWHAIVAHVAPATLSRLRLWETENNYVEYSGQ